MRPGLDVTHGIGVERAQDDYALSTAVAGWARCPTAERRDGCIPARVVNGSGVRERAHHLGEGRPPLRYPVVPECVVRRLSGAKIGELANSRGPRERSALPHESFGGDLGSLSGLKRSPPLITRSALLRLEARSVLEGSSHTPKHSASF